MTANNLPLSIILASSVNESLNDINAKRGVAVSALMVNLAIDFLVK